MAHMKLLKIRPATGIADACALTHGLPKSPPLILGGSGERGK